MGGNVFSDVEPIRLDQIQPTLNAYQKSLQTIFPNSNIEFVAVGSVGKKELSGDLDLAISTENFISLSSYINTSKFNNRVELLSKRARTSTIEQLKVKAILLELADIINDNNQVDIKVNSKKITTYTMFSRFNQFDVRGVKLDKFVQIDWMIGDIDWLSFSHYSDVYFDSMVKGLHRTQLLVAMFYVLGYRFSHECGIKDLDNNVLTNVPQSALNILNRELDINLTVEIVKNYFTLYDYLLKNTSTSYINSVSSQYLQIMKMSHNVVPSNFNIDSPHN